MVSVPNPFEAFNVARVFDAPDMVTVEAEPLVKMDPAPDVFQFPDTTHPPVDRVIVPLVPPVIVTLVTATVDAFAVRTALLATVALPPIRPRSVVAKVVVPLDAPVCWIVSAPAHRSVRDVWVYVMAVDPAAVESNVRLLNSDAAKFAGVIALDTAELKMTLDVPTLQSVEFVETFVHAPPIVQTDAPNLM